MNNMFHAQSNTVATGDEGAGSGGTISYSIGQIDYTQFNGPGGSINLGVQQTYAIEEINDLDELGDQIYISVGPNPSVDWLTISSSSDIEFSYFVIDGSGKLVTDVLSLHKSQQINMQLWSSGMYILNIAHANKTVKQIKIIKQ
jgi:hypothetical protein